MQAQALKSRSLPIVLSLALLVFASGPVRLPGIPVQDRSQTSLTIVQGRVMLAEALESEFTWLKSTQRPDGAITFNQDRDKVIPYFANLAAVPLLEKDPGAVRLYMEWYLERLNAPDRLGLYGTIYDRYYDNGIERTTEDYDSADSYAATFLSLVRAYQLRTGDNEWVIRNMDRVNMVAGVIALLQDEDGLVWAKPNHKMKYLMDNSENYRGLSDWAAVSYSVGRSDLGAYYSQRAVEIAKGIEDKLWDPRLGRYLWGIGRFIKRVPRSNAWYPDNVSQVYPVVFGVISPESQRAASVYSDVSKRFPNWQEYSKDDPYPWTIMAYAAAKVGDMERVKTFLEATEQKFIRTGRPEPWHSMESAFYLMTCQVIKSVQDTATK